MSALDEIRIAEARRMLDLLTTDDLPARAAAWFESGVRSPSLELLAAADDASTDKRLRLLRAAAVELELTFPTLQSARTHYVQSDLANLTTPQSVGQIVALSNGFTDELTGRLRRFFRRGSRR